MSRISDSAAHNAAPLLLQLVREHEKNADASAPASTSQVPRGGDLATSGDAA